MTDKVVVMTTCESEEEAGKIARALVEARLAACVNIVAGVRSVYRWKDAVETAQELLLVVKTSRALVPEVRTAIQAVHSYELPECIAVPIVDGSDFYLEWLAKELKQTGAGPR